MNDPLRDALVERLEVENEALRDRVRVLEDMLVDHVALPIEWALSRQESLLFAGLVHRGLLTKDGAMAVVYGGLGRERDVNPKIIDVFICKIRKKLKPHGVRIETLWGRGWQLAAEDRARFRAMLTPPAAHGRMTGT